MSGNRTHSWKSIHALLCERIHDRTWAPGELIPGEVALAEQFGCARTTVNRALRELAAAGLIDRKRKAGTRVAKIRTRKAIADIPVIKLQVESSGRQYRFAVVANKTGLAPARVASKMRLDTGSQALHIKTVHYADESPFVFEDRWVNTCTVPEIQSIDFNRETVNEWLVRHIPFSAGHLALSAYTANKTVAARLRVNPGDALLYSERQTWLHGQSVTLAGMYYTAGFAMEFDF